MKKITRAIVALLVMAGLFGTFGGITAQAAQYFLVEIDKVADVDLIKQNSHMREHDAEVYVLSQITPVEDDIVWCMYNDQLGEIPYCYMKYTDSDWEFPMCSEENLATVFAEATHNYILFCDNPEMGGTVTMTVNKNGAEYTGHNKTFKLYQADTEKYTGTGTEGTVTFSVMLAGTYDLYDGAADTGFDIVVDPSSNPELTINYYTVQFAVSDAGIASGSTISATYDGAPIDSGDIVFGGETLVITAVGAPGYAYSWTGAGTNGETTAALTIPNLAGQVNASCTVSGNFPYFADGRLGRNTAAYDRADGGDLPVMLNEGSYSLSGITADGRMLTEGKDYSFSGGKVTFTEDFLATLANNEHKIVFDMTGGADPVLTLTVTDSKPFDDILSSQWFYRDVLFCYKNGLMSGTGARTFSPYDTTMRGMIATILWRLDGEPEVSGDNPFSDVASGKYYTEAIVWAAENKIANGYDAKNFGPEDNITREQFAVILYNYCVYKGIDVSAQADLSKFSDSGKASDYAETAMKWAVAAGLFKGYDDGTLDPAGDTLRCESAALLHRFCEEILKGISNIR